MIPVSKPSLLGCEGDYVQQAISEGWVSSTGRFVHAFESSFSQWLGTEFAVSASSGTTALHLALAAIGVGPGDEVIVPSLSFVATHNAVLYCGATPVFVDVDPRTWGVSAETIERAVSPRTKAIVVVHLYGLPVDMSSILSLAAKRGIKVVEDAAEALGGRYLGRACGTMGHVACFSFYGNKVMTTGEGGMLVTNDVEIANRARLLRGQGQDPNRRYFHIEVGFNYRLTNVQSAIGCAQLERLDDFLLERSHQFANYDRLLGASALGFHLPEPLPGCIQAPWLFTLLLPDDLQSARDQLVTQMLMEGVETRPTFEVAYLMPPYSGFMRVPQVHENSEHISKSGISLPTFSGLTIEQQVTVVESLERTAKMFRDGVSPGAEALV